mmetsp:Transcript_7568/g.23872  ORF Transcript_7568/g.23872 Transcript_7568/m.23872 type:complete len:129 (-) Transcript_7568:843-1229(-)
MGFVPYILFLHALRRRRAAPLLVLELPNCSRSHYQDVVPSVPSFRAALETLLRREFGVARSVGALAVLQQFIPECSGMNQGMFRHPRASLAPLGHRVHLALFAPLAVGRRVRVARPLSRHRLLLDGDE